MNKSYYNKTKIYKENIPVDVLFILKKLKESGFLSFLVGGCIRDLILKRPVRDWDFVTDAQMEQIKMIFNAYKTLVIGKGFQTVTIILNHKAFQVSSIAKSNYQKFSTNHTNHNDSYKILKDNLMSRDFTINAISWNPDKGLVDPANGLQDLRNKIIRSINPDSRFKEDPLRMLRAIRMACELSFVMSPEVKKSIFKKAFLLKAISPERIKDEITFILESLYAKKGLVLLCKFSFDRYIFSLDRIKKKQISKKKKNKLVFTGMKELKKDLPSKLALFGRLYYGSCKSACLFYLPIIKFLRFPKKIIKTVVILLNTEWQEVDFKNDIRIRFILARFGEENTWRIFLLKKTLLLEQNKIAQLEYLKIEEKLLKEEMKKKPPLRINDLAINGDDLIKMGLPKGKKIGEILRMLLEKVITNPGINKKKYLIKFVQKIIIEMG